MRFPEDGLARLPRASCPPFLLTRIRARVEASQRKKSRQTLIVLGLAMATFLLLFLPLAQQRKSQRDLQIAQFVYTGLVYRFYDHGLSKVESWQEEENNLFWATFILSEASLPSKKDLTWSNYILQDELTLGGEG